MKITKRQLRRIIKEAMRGEVILDYNRPGEADVIVGELTMAGLRGIEVWEERPGKVSVAAKDDYQMEAIIDILGPPMEQR